MRAAIYTRISSDPSGRRAGVQRQADECAALVESRGWELAASFEDNDRSAYSGRRRDGYEALLLAIDAGEIDAVVAWHPDRLHRSPTELERFIDLVERHGTAVATVQGGSYDLSTASGRMTARVVGAVARHESEHKSERHKAKAAELAKQGKVSGGGTRPFGYEVDRITVRESEADLIRDAVRSIIEGASLGSVVADWQTRGVVTPAGKPWRRTPLKRMLSSPRIAGLRAHRGEVIGPAEWVAVITEADHHAIAANLDSRKQPRRAARKYLLTGGLAVCGLCGDPLVARPRSDGRRCIVCPGGVMGGCGKIRILAEPLEDHVRDRVLDALASPALIEAVDRDGAGAVDGEALVADLRTTEAALDQLAVDHYTERLIGRSEFLAARSALDQRIAGLKDQLAAAGRTPILGDLEGAAAEILADAWETAALAWRRQLLAAVVERVVIKPAVRGRNRFDPDRIEIVWTVPPS